MKKKLLIVSLYFHPEQFRINDIACEFVKRGYDVTVVTGIPNYPVGKIYEGYGYFKKRSEVWNGVRIKRLFIFPRGKSRFWLFLNYVSFVLSGYLWALTERDKYDTILVYAVSPIFQALPALAYAKRKGVPCYLYLQDLWPDSLEIAGGIGNEWILSIVNRIVERIHNRSTKILVTSRGLLETLLQRGVPVEKLVYVPQYAEEFYKPIEGAKVDWIESDKFNVTYTGNVGYVQGLDVLPRTAKILKDRGITNVRFNIVGDGRYLDELVASVRESGVEEMFKFAGLVPAVKVPEILAASDVAFLSYKPTPLLSLYIPAKLQSYMACGVPILAAADGETRRIIDEARCGRCVQPGDEKALADAIRELMNLGKEKLRELGVNARRYYEEHFEKSRIISQLEKILFGG